MRKEMFYLSLIMLLLLVSCATSNLVKDKTFTKPIKIAILPFANETTDLASGELSRLFFIIGMKEKGYDVVDMETTDRILKENGITDGGQLNSISPTELQKKLGTEGLLYGTVIDAEYSTLGIVKKKKATVKIIVKQNDKNVWEDQDTVKEGGLGNLANPLQGLAEQVVDKTFEKAFAKYSGHPLEPLFEQLIYKLQNKMPGKRVEESGWN